MLCERREARGRKGCRSCYRVVWPIGWCSESSTKATQKEPQAGIIKLVAEKTHTVIVERAAGHVALKRTLERERNHLRCLLERIASAYDKTTAQLGNAIFLLEGHDRHLVGLCRHIKLQMSLKQKRARQNRQRRQSMITSTLTKPKISKRGARRYSAPTASRVSCDYESFSRKGCVGA